MTTQKPPSQQGCVWLEECVELCDADPIFVDEQGVRATFQNPRRKKIRKIHYDRCLDTEAGITKADYIVSLAGVVDIIVELKGSHTNLSHALEQVENTLERWQNHPMKSAKPAALIVFGVIYTRDDLPRRRPKALATIQSIKGDFRRRFEGKYRLLVHESGEKKFKFDDFLR